MSTWFNPTSVSFWVYYAVLLIAQNFSFTFVSRARNSGSLTRHVKAALLSNGVWFIGQIFAVGAMLEILTGKFGVGMQVFSVLFYTLFTVLGSVVAHWFALRNEKGKSAVGASKKYVQITPDEWREVQWALVWLKKKSDVMDWMKANDFD